MMKNNHSLITFRHFFCAFCLFSMGLGATPPAKEECEPKWEHKDGISSHDRIIDWKNNRLFYTTRDNHIKCISLKDGSLIWKNGGSEELFSHDSDGRIGNKIYDAEKDILLYMIAWPATGALYLPPKPRSCTLRCVNAKNGELIGECDVGIDVNITNYNAKENKVILETRKSHKLIELPFFDQ